MFASTKDTQTALSSLKQSKYRSLGMKVRVYQPDVSEREIMKKRASQNRKTSNGYRQSESDPISLFGIDEDTLDSILKSTPISIVCEKCFLEFHISLLSQKWRILLMRSLH